MARLIVIADNPPTLRPKIEERALMDEEVKPEHLADEHIAQQIIERMAWAILDAQEPTGPRSPERGRQ